MDRWSFPLSRTNGLDRSEVEVARTWYVAVGRHGIIGMVTEVSFPSSWIPEKIQTALSRGGTKGNKKGGIKST